MLLVTIFLSTLKFRNKYGDSTEIVKMISRYLNMSSFLSVVLDFED